MTYQSYLEELRGVIQRVHGFESEHVKTVAVKETLQGKTIWDGLVEVFRLKGHPSAERAYAWTQDTDNPERPRRNLTVLDLDPSKSAQDVVRAAVVQEVKNLEEQNKMCAVEKQRLPKDEPKDRIVPLRFKAEELKETEAGAKANNRTISEWFDY